MGESTVYYTVAGDPVYPARGNFRNALLTTPYTWCTLLLSGLSYGPRTRE